MEANIEVEDPLSLVRAHEPRATPPAAEALSACSSALRCFSFCLRSPRDGRGLFLPSGLDSSWCAYCALSYAPKRVPDIHAARGALGPHRCTRRTPSRHAPPARHAPSTRLQ